MFIVNYCNSGGPNNLIFREKGGGGPLNMSNVTTIYMNISITVSN